MAKGNSGKLKQDNVLNQFQRDIRSESSRTWLNATETAIQLGKTKLKPAPEVEPIRISHYNPNNPLNGSPGWKKEQHLAYRELQKQTKKAN